MVCGHDGIGQTRRLEVAAQPVEKVAREPHSPALRDQGFPVGQETWRSIDVRCRVALDELCLLKGLNEFAVVGWDGME